jgi:hypothetical protein
MSILKGILHHWNKTNSAYDTIHPETEVSQVTDWNQGIVNTLASTALSGLVNTLTSDSLLAKMIQKVFEATGVKYSLGQNGYVCFGSLVGGLIIQWISTNTPGGNASSVSLPIAYKRWYKIVATGVVDSSDGDFKQTVAILKDYNWSMTSFALRTSGSDSPAAFCITIGV